MRTIIVAITLALRLWAQDFSVLDRQIEAELQSSGIPGAALVIVQDGRIAYLKGYGVANVETGEIITPDTLFRIGSTTKMFTAAAAMSLAAEGKLDLSKPISTYVTELDPKIAAITTHQLLSHTAGLGDRGSGHGSHDDSALGAAIRGLKQDMLELPPGEIFSYSSLGYWTAGFVIETIAGKPFADVVAERVFKPAGMLRSTFRPLLAMTYPIAQQHQGARGQKATVIRPFADDVQSWPGGSAFSNARDLGQFMTAFLGGVFPAVVIRAMSTSHTAFPGSDDTHYAYGLVSSTERGVRTLSHGGARIGFGSMLMMAPEQKAGVAVLANRSNAMLNSVAQKALELVVKFGPAGSETEMPPQTAEQISRYPGTYSGGPIRVDVALMDGKLMVTMDGKSYPAKSIGGGRFTVEGPLGYFVMVPGPDGEPRYMHTNLRALKKQ